MTTYRITFARVGRHGSNNNPAPAPVDIAAENSTRLAEQLCTIVRPLLASREIEIVVNLATGQGFIFCGPARGGSFTIAEVPAADETADGAL